MLLVLPAPKIEEAEVQHYTKLQDWPPLQAAKLTACTGNYTDYFVMVKSLQKLQNILISLRFNMFWFVSAYVMMNHEYHKQFGLV